MNIRRRFRLSSRKRHPLLEAPDDTPFITSDNPVIVLDDNAKKLGPEEYRPTSGLRFGFPLSPKFVLSGLDPPAAGTID
jgi:hypothetical protein